MPTLADLTVKKADNTTDVIYKGVSPASGEGVPAVWKNQTVGTTPGQQPELRIASRARSKKGVPYRLWSGSYKYPKAVSNVSTGELTLSDGVTVTFAVDSNQTMSSVESKEAVYQCFHLLALAVMKQAAADGYSFT